MIGVALDRTYPDVHSPVDTNDHCLYGAGADIYAEERVYRFGHETPGILTRIVVRNRGATALCTDKLMCSKLEPRVERDRPCCNDAGVLRSNEFIMPPCWLIHTRLAN